MAVRILNMEDENMKQYLEIFWFITLLCLNLTFAIYLTSKGYGFAITNGYYNFQSSFSIGAGLCNLFATFFLMNIFVNKYGGKQYGGVQR
jgi:hypothetical protein